MKKQVMVLAAFLCGLIHNAHASETCPKRLPADPENETALAKIVGLSILGPANQQTGTVRATRCLFELFGDKEALLAGAAAPVSDSLLALMTLDPVRWFDAATSVDPYLVDKWLGGALEYSQVQWIGGCVMPDKYVQASHAIESLKFANEKQEKLRQRIGSLVPKLHCKVGESM